MPDGRRQYLIPQLGHEQFDAIRRGVAVALGLNSLFSTQSGRSDLRELASAENLNET
jgi:hypothetical protein